jgi:glucose/arabinose dehydrogenase
MNRTFKASLILGLFGLLPVSAKVTDYYSIENVVPPKLLVDRYGKNGIQTDGLDFMPDGRLVACFVGGEVFTLDRKNGKWTLFADGLHTPLGVVALNDREVMVSQRPELTLLRDLDKDGVADEYKSFCDDFGISGNYHEFHFGPIRDKAGNFYVSLGTASSGADVRHEKRGFFDKRSYLQRMYASVPYRGWVLQVTPEGKMIPWASGLRTPNGLGFDLEGNLFVSDNQGDWVGTSKLHHVEKGKFYGHAASLLWEKDWSAGKPVDTPLSELNAKRETAAILFPHGLMSNSPSQPLVDSTAGKFGPYAGQMLIGEMNKGRIMRVILEKVGGKIQGACLPFFDGNGLNTGNNRLCFSPDGATLWVGHSNHGWAGNRGIQTLTWTGKTPPDVHGVTLTRTGFSLTFTVPLDENSVRDVGNYAIKSYAYKYHQSYGSPQVGVKKITPSKATLSKDGKTLDLQLPEMQARKLYEISLKQIRTSEGSALLNPLLVYHAHNLRE